MIIIEFEFTTNQGVFRDAIHLPENHGMSDDEINQLKLQRLNNWLDCTRPVDTSIDNQEG